jgi:hypothetical protein
VTARHAPSDSLGSVRSAVTRRRFLARAGVVAGGAVLAGTATGATELLRRAVSSAPSASAPRLNPTRRRTYVALVDAVGRGSRSQVDPSRAGAAADALAADYAAALEPTRHAIDAVLDRLEGAPVARPQHPSEAHRAPGRPFSRLDPTARIALLRTLAHDQASDLAGRAVALAAAPFHPSADDYHPTPVTLL